MFLKGRRQVTVVNIANILQCLLGQVFSATNFIPEIYTTSYHQGGKKPVHVNLLNIFIV